MEYDYIVVGAGTAGCVLAARLSADPGARVLLLEAGGAARTRAMTMPGAWPENLGSVADWAGVTTPQADAGPLPYPRGRTLGGSGAINAMAHVRGHRTIYDGWAADGAPGWAFADLLPHFRASERADGHDPALRGTEGPVRVAPAADRHPVASAFADALTGMGCPTTDDLSGPVQEGVGWADLAISGGERISPADAYLRPVLDRPNLTVETRALVTRLQVRHGQCTGVGYLRGGASAAATTRGEVILAAGAIGSPQLLLLSGIGPARPLRDLGITVVADVAAVGANLQDHPMVMASCAARSPLPPSRYNHGEMYAAVHSGSGGGFPDLQLFPILLPLAPQGLEPPAGDGGYALVAAVVAPASRGTVRLATADPAVAPQVDPGFLTDARDTDRLETGLRMVREAAAGARLSPLLAAEVWPGPDVVTRAGLRGYIRRAVGSYYHPAGTCRIGPDDRAAVDPDLRVHGVAGLRVADASVMPTIPNAPLNATVLAIAERAASLITGG